MAEVAITTGPATTPADYAARIERVRGFAKRLHIDLADGVFAPTKTIGPAQVYGLPGAALDFHLMLAHPEGHTETLISLEPNLVIAHFEAEIDHANWFDAFRPLGIKVGLAILPDTSVSQVEKLLPTIDHLLVFTGTLGHDAGQFQSQCLGKISQAKAINPALEVGVDGGIDAETAVLALEAGADVLNSGSYIRDAKSPANAYQKLAALAGVPIDA